MFSNPKRLIQLSVAVSVLLMLAKFFAYFITQSTVVLTDAAESIINVLASSFALYSIYLAAVPRDKNHPYGHGKVEFFAAGVEGILIFIAGLFIIAKAIFSFFNPAVIEEIEWGALIIGATGGINFFVGHILVKKGEELNSLTLQADGHHLKTDAYSSWAVVIGLGLIYLSGITVLDSLLSMGIGLYIVYNGYLLARKFVSGLMDETNFSLLEDVVRSLSDSRRACWIDIHNLRLQQYGSDLHFDGHLTLPRYYDLDQAHAELSRIDGLISKQQGCKVEFFIHTDPCLPQCCHYCKVENCPVRSEPCTREIEWTVDLLMENHKHFIKPDSDDGKQV